MHKRAGKLNQPFVKRVIRTALSRQPELFQDIMRLEKLFAIEIIEVRQVMRIQSPLPEGFNHFRNSIALVGHNSKIPSQHPNRKSFLRGVDIHALVGHSACMAAKPALGRGLSALLGGSPALAKAPLATTAPGPALDSASVPPVNSEDRVERIPLGRLRPCALQPRKHFAPEALQELADSIRERGILQPLIVRKHGDYFELIAGERRWRAAQLAGLADAPAIVREADDRAVLELALIENLQRENLNAIEEAQGYSQLIGQFQLKQDEIAARVGKSRAVVANALRLLKLAAPIQSAIRDGRLSVGHAKVILGIAGEEQQQLAANRILKENLNVRQTEAMVAKLQSRPAGTSKARSASPGQDGHVAGIENQLRERLGAKVHLRYSQGKGALEIWFFSDDDLERLLQILGIQPD